MRVEFKKLEIQNFMCFESATFEFHDSGLHLICGKVERADAPSANSNGAGKCLPEDSPVLMSDGSWRKLKEVRVGDWVMCADFGKGCCVPSPVVAVRDSGEKEVYEITFSDGGKVCASGEHIFPMKFFAGGPFKMRSVFELVKKYQSSDIKPSRRARFLTLPIEYPERALPLDPYLIGLLLGDGICDLDSRPGYWVTTTDSEIVEYCRGQSEMFGFEQRNDGMTYRVFPRRYGSSAPSDILASLGMKGKRAESKEIPQSYLRSSVEQRKHLLAGLVDTDGYVGSGSMIELSTKSEKLKDGIVELFYSLGGRAKAVLREDGKNWRVYGHLPRGCVLPLKVKRKLEVHKEKSRCMLDYSLRIVRDVKLVGRKRCGDIQVAHKDHCFVSHSYVVTGNSAIFEALTWCLFGKTLRGMRANDVVRIGSEGGCVVKVEFVKGDRNYAVRRYRLHPILGNRVETYVWRTGSAPEETTKSIIAETDRHIVDNLGFSFDLFRNSVCYGQGLPYRFAQATDAEKKGILEEILSMGWVRRGRLKASQALRDYQEARRAVGAETDSLWARLHDHRDRIRELSSLQQPDPEEGEHDEIASLESELRSLQSERKRIDEEVATMVAEVKKEEEHLKKLRDEIADRNNELTRIRTETNLFTMKMEACEKRIEEAKSRKLLGKDCPTCKRKITASALKGIEATAKSEIQSIKRKLQRRRNRENAISYEVVELLSWRHQVEERLSEKIAVRDGLTNQRPSLLARIASCRERIDAKRREVAKPDNISRLIQEERQRAEALEESIQKNRELEEYISSLIRVMEFWEEGFGNQGLKSLIIDNLVPFLNHAARRYSTMLTDGEVEVEFRTQTETLRGEVRERFEVDVTHRSGTDYAGGSGGEKRRVDVIVLLALHDLIAWQNGVDTNILIFDEVFENLDEVGTERLVLMLRDKAAGSAERGERPRAVYIISHTDELVEECDDTLWVRKDSRGISLLERRQ